VLENNQLSTVATTIVNAVELVARSLTLTTIGGPRQRRHCRSTTIRPAPRRHLRKGDLSIGIVSSSCIRFILRTCRMGPSKTILCSNVQILVNCELKYLNRKTRKKERIINKSAKHKFGYVVRRRLPKITQRLF